MRLRFLTSTPLDVARGSGTYVGMTTLADSLRRRGVEIEWVTPSIKLPVYTLQRLIFNRQLRARQMHPVDATVGFDMDGYTLVRKPGSRHVASIKGVIADEMRFESGMTRATMVVQARCERLHVQGADLVITTSKYSAGRIQALYRVESEPKIVPEAIDLQAWQRQLSEATAERTPGRFVVLTVCRFYPRKRLHVLLGAAARLRNRIPGLEIRIVGGGPQASRLRKICSEEQLGNVVTWRENISQEELAAEYRCCDVFCLPSVQEGFGIVFLEAMAAGQPIVAARAAAMPEVVRHGLLADPDSDESLAAAIEKMYREPDLRRALAAAAGEWVKQFDADVVAGQFVRAMEELVQRP